MAFTIIPGLAGVFFLFTEFFTGLLGPVSAFNPLFILVVPAPTLSGFIIAAIISGRHVVFALQESPFLTTGSGTVLPNHELHDILLPPGTLSISRR
jgi:hypothetical protein